MGSLLVGVALLYLHSFVKPDALAPSGEEARLQINRGQNLVRKGSDRHSGSSAGLSQAGAIPGRSLSGTTAGPVSYDSRKLGRAETSDLPSTDLNHVLDGSRLLYLVVAFSYRDSTTPQDAYRISESCEYFTRTLQSGRACGRNGTSLEKLEPAAPR